jgi:hypothetical protein
VRAAVAARWARILPPWPCALADAIDLVACDVFERPDRAQAPITPQMVERRLTQLAAHAPGCRCRLHVAAAKVRKSLDVYYRALG